jgi:cytochrome bd-type quinol oxidase subunit 2
MNLMKKLMIIIAFASTLVSMPAAASIQSDFHGSVCRSAGFLAGCQGKTLTTNGHGGHGYLFDLFNTLLLVAGTLAVIFIIIGGLNYITSEGDPEKTGNAKSTLQYAVIGLVVVAASEAIVSFVTSRI